MSVPVKRRTSGKTRRGRAHEALKNMKLGKCPKCAKAILPHRACGFCGAYKGREALKVKTKSKKESK